MDVGVIDDAIDLSHPDLSGLQLEQILFNSGSNQGSGHGTAVAGRIAQSIGFCRIYNGIVLDNALRCDANALADAIRWCIGHEIRIINISMGTTDVMVAQELRKECANAASKGTIVVAAQHNLGLESYPASFPEVIGVTGAAIHEPGGYYYRPGETIECVARGDEQRLCWLDGKHVFLSGNSFAAPHITGIIANWMEEEPGMTLPEVRQKLKENALPEPAESGRRGRTIVDMATSASRDDLSWIKRAVVYPMNKEMHALVRYRDLLDFEIVGVADHVGKGMVGQDVGEAVGVKTAGIKVLPRIQNLMDFEANTLILGYVDQLGRIEERDLVEEYVGMALDHGLNVFSFMAVRPETYPQLHQRAEEKGLRIVYPDVTVEEANHALQYPNQYPQVDVPVVAVLGTSSQQGKFTLQLGLRRRLLELGYKVGQLGTEHHSMLFGMDAAFPIGYASPVRLPIRFYVPYLDHKMREINGTGDPDLILIGSQSGTIPYDIVEHSTHSVTSVPFLFGTKPDAAVLVVNSIDHDDYIQDTIDALRSIAKCKVIALAMSDKAKHIRSAYGRSMVTPQSMPESEIDQHLSRLQSRFRLPVHCIARQEDVQKLTGAILDYFSEKPDADRVGEEVSVEYAAD
jgi:uncharacterized NAD-dependent epimerase/dehydratase family protein